MGDLFVLIMAGGEGTRFAPYSTPERPKQFLKFIGDETFIQQTRARISDLVPPERILVSTNVRYFDLVRDQLPDIPAENIIIEPVKRNTAPTIGYSARLICERDPEAIMVVLPSDHFIRKRERFIESIEYGVRIAREKRLLVTLGIRPTWPATCYGYIKSDSSSLSDFPLSFAVGSFVEKPDEKTAARYIADPAYHWNSGMFVWAADSILKEYRIHLGDVHRMLVDFQPGSEFRDYFFTNAKAISVDYGILEKTNDVVVIPCELGWSDVGTWENLYRLSCDGDVRIRDDVLTVMRQELGHMLPTGEDGLPRLVEKPWGYEEIWAHTKDYVGKIITIKKAHRLSYQYHRVKEESIRMLDGIMDLEYACDGDRRTVRMSGGDVFHIPPRTYHRFTAVEDCRLLEVSTPFLEDVVRIEDDYGRERG